MNTPITDDGLVSVQFFNGRVLSAADLQDEQAAHKRQRAQVGRAAGTGIVHGLRVRVGPGDTPTTLRVTKGLALNRAGDPVELYTDVEVSVVDVDTDREPVTDGRFDVCAALPEVTATGTGAYVLVACPASSPRERAPRVDPVGGDGYGVVGSGRAGSCGPKYREEGVCFRVVHLDTGASRLADSTFGETLDGLMRAGLTAPERSRRRNLLAHWCLGTTDARGVGVDLYDRLSRAETSPYSTPQYGPLDALRTPATPGADPLLMPQDVPLAVFVWEEDRVTTVDEWAVRRRVHRQGGAAPSSDRRRAEGEAAFRQFQAHVADLTAPGGFAELLPVLQANLLFAYLPSAGLVPTSITEDGEARLDFFDGMTHRDPIFIEGTDVTRLLDASVIAPPHAIASGEVLAVYRVRQNAQSSASTPYLLFANGFLPTLEDARFDLSRWDYSHYAFGIHP